MQIEVFSDIACPFCYIGEKRLHRALELRPSLQAERLWRPFQLQPQLPKAGVPWQEFAVQKFGGMAQMKAAFAQVLRVAEGEGIRFDLENIYSAANTADAHRLILLAREHDLELEVAQALFQAYFSDGLNLGDPATLQAIAASAGLTQGVPELLSSQRFVQEVETSQVEASQLGVQGVPFYIFNRRVALSGAQPLEVFLQAIDKAMQ
jgi:predicted DsbA family dithiol-disulfide isomerase